MSEIEFINGLIFKAPSEKAPDYVRAKGSIKVSELMAWLDGRETEWVNFDVKVSKAGKWYAAVDSWEPTKDQQYKEGVAQAKKSFERVTVDGLPGTADHVTADIAFDDSIPF
jgi:hypothetical protein